jgi:hypothetical protein
MHSEAPLDPVEYQDFIFEKTDFISAISPISSDGIERNYFHEGVRSYLSNNPESWLVV